MSTMVEDNLTASTTEEHTRLVWKERIQRARDAQKPLIPIWLSNLAFAAGQHWLVWDRVTDGLRHIRDVDPAYADRNLLTADRISEYRDAQLGELSSDDDRPQLLTAQTGDDPEEIARTLNAASAYQWEHEADAEEVLAQVWQYVVDLGTAAIRCYRDGNYGKVIDHQPFDTAGRPVTPDTHPQDWQTLQEQGTMADGTLPIMQPIREGRTCWKPYTAFQILTPPGVNHESRFPWEVLVDVVTLDELADQYGPQAVAGLTEDTNIASAMGLSTGQVVKDPKSQGAASSPRVKGAVWRYLCFQRPSAKYPDGQFVVLVSNDYRVMEAREGLDYQLPNGDPHTGVVYFHWRRLIDRFYSRAWIEATKDPQREINQLETFKTEIVARGGPKVMVAEGALPHTPTGQPFEVIELKDTSLAPQYFAGIGPGPWMDTEKAGWVDNLAHAAAMSQIKLGEVPPSADTYSALALLNEAEAGKRSYIRLGHSRSIGTLVELGVWDIRRYWPSEKTILVGGSDDPISSEVFRKETVPDFYMVKVAKGAPEPRSQGAELKKIDAFWAAAEQSGLVASDPASWVAWYVESVNAGVAQDLPEPAQDSQQRMAAFENTLMQHGEQPPVFDYDLPAVHLPAHREAQDHARAAGDAAWLQRLTLHVQQHVLQAQTNAATVEQARQTPAPDAAAPAGAPPVFVRPDFLQLARGN